MARAIVRPQPLHEQAIDHLREMIIDGTLQPKQRISEKDLCEKLGISRTPLREALKVLAAEGLIILLARRGAIVSEVTSGALEEKFEVIRMIEGFAIAHMRQNCTPALVDELQAIQDEMTVALEKANARKYFASNEKFHKALVKSTRNKTMIEMHASLFDHLRRARLFGLLAQPMGRKFLDSHARIINALRQSEFQLAEREISFHLGTVEEAVFHAIKDSQSRS